MYNPGMTLSVGSYAEVANSTIHLSFVDQDIYTGEKFCSMEVTLPWGNYDPFFGGDEGDIITREVANGFYAIKIMSINIAARTVTLRVLSYASGYVANIGIDHNLSSMVAPGGTVNYDFELTNQSAFNVQIRWLATSKIGSQYDYPRAYGELALPPTAYHDIGCWYDDWAIGGVCANGQTLIGNGGSGHITGSFTASTNQGQYENIALFVFVYVSNYWGVGKHEYVETARTYHSVLITPCVGVTCDPICVRDPTTGIWNKWSQQCNPSTVLCEPYQIITQDDPTCCTPNWQCEPGGTGYEIDGCGHRIASILCTATNYIEYDFSFLPSSFLDLVTSNIVYISSTIGGYLPLPSNIQYVGSSYANGKFRVYVDYTLPLSGLSSSSPQLVITTPIFAPYISPNNNINLSRAVQSLQIVQTIETFATALVAIIVFIIALLLGLRYGWFGVVGAAIIAVIAAVVVNWKIHSLLTGDTGSHTGAVPTPKEKIEIVKEYFTVYLEPSCRELYPTCATTPPTCDEGTMRAYVGCMGGAKLAQCKHAATQAGDPEDSCDPARNDIIDIDTCLANATCTPEEAKNLLEGVIDDADDYIGEKENQVTCDPGYVYNIEQKKCVPEEQCLIREPLTGKCIIGPDLAQTAMMLVGIAVGGFILYKVVTRPKS